MKFESAAHRADRFSQATHVLIIACGSYPDIAGIGVGDPGPMDSPILSAHALANWFMSGPDANPGTNNGPDKAFHNPDAPLGTLTMLTSPMEPYTSPAGVQYQVDRPSFSNVKTAYREWIDRLTSPNSRGIFYFCGHGVGDGSMQTLLTDDTGCEERHDRWAGAFNLSRTFDASVRRTVTPILFLIDSCFEFSRSLVLSIQQPISLLGGDVSGPVLSKPYLIRAAGANRLAYAAPGEVSRFTSSLLAALSGYCGMQRVGAHLFDVVGPELMAATGAFLERTNIDGVPQAELGDPQGNGTGIAYHVLNSRPKVIVELDVNPTAYRATGYGFVQECSEPNRSQVPFGGSPAKFEVPQGTYHYGAGNGAQPQKEIEHKNQLLRTAVYSHCVDL